MSNATYTEKQQVAIDSIKAQAQKAGISLLGEHDHEALGIFEALHYMTYEGKDPKTGQKVRMSIQVNAEGKITRSAL